MSATAEALARMAARSESTPKGVVDSVTGGVAQVFIGSDGSHDGAMAVPVELYAHQTVVAGDVVRLLVAGPLVLCLGVIDS